MHFICSLLAITMKIFFRAGIKEVYADPNGTRVVVIDVKGSGYIFSPINDELTALRDLPEKVTTVLWDTSITDR